MAIDTVHTLDTPISRSTASPSSSVKRMTRLRRSSPRCSPTPPASRSRSIIETSPLASELERLKALEDERAAVNAEAIAFRKAAKKAGTPQAEIDAHTEAADARLKALDARIDHAESAGLDPHRSEIRLVQVYGGGRSRRGHRHRQGRPRGPGAAAGRLRSHSWRVFDLAHLGHRGVTLGRVHDTQQAAKLVLGASKCSLAATVKHYLKVDLSKELQASDWASPELSEDQLRYAARDVIWLWRAVPAAVQGSRAAGLRLSNSGRRGARHRQDEQCRHRHRSDRHADALRALAEQDAIACAGYRDACLEMGRPELARRSRGARARSRLFSKRF